MVSFQIKKEHENAEMDNGGDNGEDRLEIMVTENIPKKQKSKTEILKRYALFIVGLFIASMGVAFSTKAGLGTFPVASVPYSVSLVSKLLTFGG